MTRLLRGALAAIGLLALAPAAEAQISPFDANFGFDPFSTYYGYYLPRQQSIAAQQAYSSTATLNLNAAARRAVAPRPTQGLYNSGYDPYTINSFEDRPFVRPPTVLVPGRPAGPNAGGYFGRTSTYYLAAPSGMPGSAQLSRGRLPSLRYSRPSGLGAPNLGGITSPAAAQRRGSFDVP